MTPTIEVRASRSEIEAYQQLLRSDWNKDTLNDVLSLLEKFVAASLASPAQEWEFVLTKSSAKASGKDLNLHIVERIKDLAEVFTEPSIPPMPTVFSTNRTQSIAQAEKTWGFLIVPAMARITGETGLFRDTQSLLFWCAIHCLLPQLLRQGLKPEHDCLVNAMYVHTLLAWRSQPAQLFYLQSALADHLGDERRRLELLEMSLDLTPLEDHSHLTRATAYWSGLMDLGEKQRALAFLLRLSKTAPLSYNEEMAEMLAETLTADHSKSA